VDHVSILARAEARALQRHNCLTFVLRLFQSSPAPRRGRYYLADDLARFQVIVSILARAEARALQASLMRVLTAEAEFQSSPAPRRGRYPCVGPAFTGIEVFQSSPAPRRGRYRTGFSLRQLPSCFNPRPRRGAGATYALPTDHRL